MNRNSPTSARRGTLFGLALGAVALGCCVGPAVAALTGLLSATVAIDLATDLYDRWGWAFKLAAASLALLIVVMTRRQSNRCHTKPRLLRFVVVMVLSALATYGVLYGTTTWLGNVSASPPPSLWSLPDV